MNGVCVCLCVCVIVITPSAPAGTLILALLLKVDLSNEAFGAEGVGWAMVAVNVSGPSCRTKPPDISTGCKTGFKQFRDTAL